MGSQPAGILPRQCALVILVPRGSLRADTGRLLEGAGQ